MSDQLNGMNRLRKFESDPFRLNDILRDGIANDYFAIDFDCQRLSKYIPVTSSSWEKSENFLSVCHWNCHLTTSYNDILHLLDLSNSYFDVIGFCETFLTSEHFLPSFQFPGYQLFVKNRELMARGGLAFLVKNGIFCRQRGDVDVWIEGKVESFTLELAIDSKKLIVSEVYKPPSARLEDFTEGFEILMRAAVSSKLDFICMGDFNFDLYDLHAINLDFLNLMVSNDLFPLVGVPTRITSHSATIIDNIFVSSKYLKSSAADVLVFPCSDHLPVVASVPLVIAKEKKAEKKQMRQLRKQNMENLAEELSKVSWKPVFDETEDASHAFDIFMNILQPIYDKTCPLKVLRNTRESPRKPWVTSELIQMIKKRNLLYQSFLDCQSADMFEEFKKIRNQVNTLRRSCVKSYYELKLGETKGDSRGTWKVLREVLGSDKKKNTPTSLIVDGKVYEGKQSIVNHFGAYFSTIGEVVQKQDQPLSQGTSEEAFIDDRGLGLIMEAEETNMQELKEIVNSIKSNSSGSDGISLKTFKLIMVYLLPCLVYMINLSLKSGEFPQKLKEARVIPLHKSGSKTDLTNWRPISLLSVFSKMYEKVMHKKLYAHLTKHGFLSDSQFGFRKGHSTVHAMQHFLDFLNTSMENGEMTLSVFIDFKKAFDTVDFKILIDRLRSLGVTGSILKWFESYLIGRSIRVCFDDVISNKFFISCGVPQGSVLGPLLYLVYVDTMRFYVPGVVNTSFADDTVFSAAARNADDLVEKINQALSHLLIFTKISRLSVNVLKTHFILFSRKGSPVDLNGKIFLCNRPLKQVAVVRYLGFQLDQNLNWKAHGDQVAARVSRGLGLIRRLRNQLPHSALLTLYHSIVMPYISYGCVIWAGGFYTNFKRVQVLQNKVIRLLGNYVHGENDTVNCYRKLMIFNVSQLHDYQLAIFVFQSIYGLSPEIFRQMFIRNSSYHSYETRNMDDLVYECRSSQRGSFGPKFAGPVVWNSLPMSIRLSENVSQFKSRLKNHLLSRK